MKTPPSRAASMTGWPFGTSNSRPLTVTLTRSVKGAPPVVNVLHHFVLEVAHDRCDRRYRGRSQRADRGHLWRPHEARTDVVGDVQKEVRIDFPTGSLFDTTQHLLLPRRPLPARRALAARFVRKETNDTLGGTHHT